MPTSNPASLSSGLYIHVPFCLSKCPYCDFYSIPETTLLPAWQDALFLEMERQASEWPPFDTLYFGGGTPSLLSPESLFSIISRARETLPLTKDAEITLEANPGALTKESLREFRAAGVSRLSLGVQSFSDQDLCFLGRAHTARDARQCLEWAARAGFTETGFDLIFGLPSQTPDGWRRVLEEAVSFAPLHLSCYMLTLEPGTPLWTSCRSGAGQALDENLAARLFLATSDFLTERGYCHYEVSNYALGMENRSRHNIKYWNGAPYLGLGPSAHSFQNRRRWWNVQDVAAYIGRISRGETAQEEEETLTEEDRLLEAVYLGLRQSSGLGAEDLRARHGKNMAVLIENALLPLVSGGFAVWTGERFALTPQGMLRLDGIAARAAALLEDA
jgi:oxygen-independent coproporphyrinogen-3 oxidase